MSCEEPLADDASLYNNGKGIQISVQFQPLLAQCKPGEKRHKNAKATPANALYYIHEENDLMGLLGLAFVALTEARFMFHCDRQGKLITDDFVATYSITRTDAKNIALKSNADYEALLSLATEKTKPQVKLFIEELKACVHCGISNFIF